MAEENVGCLVVMEGETLKGIVTERQYVRHVALKGPVSPATRVLDIMETTILFARPEQSVAECMAVMTNKRVRHLPVIVDGQLMGILSIGDLVKSIISDQNFMIDQLEHRFARRTLMDANAILSAIVLGVLLVGVPSAM